MPILILVEYCKNCHLHSWNSRHDEIKYIDFYEQLSSRLQEAFPSVKVMERPIPDNLLLRDSHTHDGAQFIDIESGEAVHFPRLGSFEVYAGGQRIFSKIKSKRWPKFERIL